MQADFATRAISSPFATTASSTSVGGFGRGRRRPNRPAGPRAAMDGDLRSRAPPSAKRVEFRDGNSVDSGARHFTPTASADVLEEAYAVKPVPLLAVIGLLPLASTLISTDARAGLTQAPYAYCAPFSGGGGYCEGTMNGFLSDSNPNDWASFEYTMESNGATSASFNASYGGSGYGCTAVSSSVIGAFAVATNATGYFDVYWGSNGVCSGVILQSYSFWHNTW
jgi:hypothetical protein